MKRITLLALFCCICMSHAFADGFVDTGGFLITAHKHNAKSDAEKWQTLSNGGVVPVEAYVSAEDGSTLSGSIKISRTAIYEYSYKVPNSNTPEIRR